MQIQSLGTHATGENAEMFQAQMQLRALRAELSTLADDTRNRNDGLMIPGNRLPAAKLEYERNLHDVEYYETILNILAQQSELARLDEAQSVIVQTVDSATPPEKPSSPRRALIIIEALFAGILAGIAWAIAAYGFDRFRSNSSGNARLLHLWRVLGKKRIWQSRTKA